MMNNSISSPIFWMYFSYVLSFIIPLFCGLTLLTVKGAISNEQAGMHPRRLLGIIFTFSGLIFIPNMIQDIHKYITGELGLPIFDTLFAIIRRLFKGQSPFHADRKHLHHRLVDMGMNQKQSVLLLYAISALLAVAAILFAERMFTGAVLVLVVSFVIGCINWFVMKREHIEMLEKMDAEALETEQHEETKEEKPQA